MRNDWKWKLKSGVVVEDAIAEFLDKAEATHIPLLDSWILNVDDDNVMNSIFKNCESDIEEVRRSARFELCAETSEITQAIDALNVQGDELFSRLNDLSDNGLLDRNDRILLICAVQNWWSLCDNGCMLDDHSEGWWTVNLWGKLIDWATYRAGDTSFERYAYIYFNIVVVLIGIQRRNHSRRQVFCSRGIEALEA